MRENLEHSHYDLVPSHLARGASVKGFSGTLSVPSGDIEIEEPLRPSPTPADILKRGQRLTVQVS